MIRCRTLGPVELEVDGGAPPPELLWRKHLALLVYLARSPKRGRSREHLAALLWPDKPEAAARHSLNEAVRALRRACGADAVETRADQVRLAPGVAWLDVDALEEAAARGDWEAASRLIGGIFLEGFGIGDACELENWLAAERAFWRARSVEVLARRSEQLERTGRVLEAQQAADRALRLDPTSDLAARALMRSLLLSGQRSAALEQYEAFARRLAAETGAEPEPDTVALAERARRMRGPPPAPTPAPGARRLPLVGRERELERLLETWRAAVRLRHVAVLVVEGDPGIGKSRLLEEVQFRARLDGAVVAGARAVEADRAEPWAGVRSLARGGLLEATGLAAAPGEALAAFAQAIPEWADRFPACRPLAPLPPGRALVEVLRAAMEEQPILLALDDVHWLDPESLGALGLAARDLGRAPLGVLLACATHPPRPEIDELRARIGGDLAGAAVRLGPLGPDALAALAAYALPNYDGESLKRLVRRLATDSAGLPLLAVELLHAVALGLDLDPLKSAWPAPLRTLDDTLPGDLPDAITAAIRVGSRRLSAPAQRVLAAAAVLGDRVSASEVADATGLGLDATLEALDELEWQRWLVAEPRGYGFVARVVRDVVARDLLTPGQRQRILARSHC